ncbi:SWI5-dependent HO expression protein 3 [Candida viswanathii]|uniref:SWI5-dependent HO expression protein 3 n=1 Tax=Candida viswanathii TaxID=5486 RepID=A0A367YG83_9ASCO|nr:SWI5-dependent HO expression protein 3 [Candida viswanathii]
MPESPNSPSKNSSKSTATPVSSSTKVIDSLHSKIDQLTDELTTLKQSHQELTKKHTIVAKKNDSFVDQLANAKHENDMLSALLKRKERRILDLEDQYNDLNSQIENLLLLNKNMKIRCENLQTNSNASIAEFERLKISYDALIASQMEYKNHYQLELNTLQANFDKYKTENTKRYEELLNSIVSNDKDIDTLLDSLTNKRKTMDNIYVSKNNKVLQLLTSLANLIKLHAEDTKGQVAQNVGVIEILLEKYPDLQEKILEKEKIEVDLNEIISHSNEVLANTSFEEDATLINSPDLDNQPQINSGAATPVQNSGPYRKKKNYKRNSLILKDLPSGIPENNVPSSLPKKPQVNNNIINIPKNRSKFNTPPTTPRQFSNQSNDFEVTHQWSNNNNNQHNNNNNHRRTTSYDSRSDNGGHRRQYSQQGNNFSNNNNNNNTNNGFVRRSGSVRNGSNNSNQNNNYGNSNSNNNSNNHGKQAKRRSTYNPNNNSKRNSQIFDGNIALNV